MTITRCVEAWDGGTIFNYETGELEPDPYGGWKKEPFRQRSFYRYVDKRKLIVPKRKRMGRRLIRMR